MLIKRFLFLYQKLRLRLINALLNSSFRNKKFHSYLIYILENRSYDSEFSTLVHLRNTPIEQQICRYLRSWSWGLMRRKPYAGFHPGIFQEYNNKCIDPLIDYLKQGCPDGPWNLPVIKDSDQMLSILGSPKIALHIHIFYTDLIPKIIEKLNLNNLKPDLYISIPSEFFIEIVNKEFKSYLGRLVRIVVVPNHGRDIGPFLTSFKDILQDSYEFVGHIHTKKSVARFSDLSPGEIWFDFLLENLLGGKGGSMMDRIIGYMIVNKQIGLVFPDDPNIIGWDANKISASLLMDKLGISDLPENFFFPVGTMFWARAESVRPLWALNLTWEDYPSEPLADDGTILHAIERLFPLVLAKPSNKCAVTYVDGVTR